MGIWTRLILSGLFSWATQSQAGNLTSFEELHFPSVPVSAGARVGPRTDALLILRNGEVLYERYGRGFKPEQKHIAWSVSKSVMSLLYGIALKENKFALEDSICHFLDHPREDLCQIRFRHLLQWTSGLKWVEEYEKTKRPRQASILAMLYGEGRMDMASFVMKHPLVYKPGTAWRYSSGDSMLLSYLLGRIYNRQDIYDLIHGKLFAPLGIQNAVFERDGIGSIAGAYYLHISPRDLARIGTFMLEGGTVKGRQLLDPSWFDFIYEVPRAFIEKSLDHSGRHRLHIGGGHWWLNDHVQAQTPEPPMPKLPKDAFFAQGHWGQYLIVVPSMKLVVVRMGDTRDGSMNITILADSVVEWLNENKI